MAKNSRKRWRRRRSRKNDFVQKSIVEINNGNNSEHQPNAIQYKTLCFIFTISNWFVFICMEYTASYTVYHSYNTLQLIFVDSIKLYLNLYTVQCTTIYTMYMYYISMFHRSMLMLCVVCSVWCVCA